MSKWLTWMAIAATGGWIACGSDSTAENQSMSVDAGAGGSGGWVEAGSGGASTSAGGTSGASGVGGDPVVVDSGADTLPDEAGPDAAAAGFGGTDGSAAGGTSGASGAGGDPIAVDGGVDALPDETGPLTDASVEAASPDAETGSPFACHVSVCLAGAVTRDDGGNPRFGEVCKELPGILYDSGYPMFSMLQLDDALKALVAALDTTHDGQVNGADEPCEVVLVGYSWGGVNAVDLAKNYLADPRVAQARRHVHKLVAIDPYAPMGGSNVRVVAGVGQFWEYRHSESPPTDCSKNAPWGPYQGLPPLCAASVVCRDYDYSSTPTVSYPTFLGGALRGSDVGHCTIVDVAGPALLHNVNTGTDFEPVPPSQPIGTF